MEQGASLLSYAATYTNLVASGTLSTYTLAIHQATHQNEAVLHCFGLAGHTD